jgi:hypothetical protein
MNRQHRIEDRIAVDDLLEDEMTDAVRATDVVAIERQRREVTWIEPEAAPDCRACAPIRCRD